MESLAASHPTVARPARGRPPRPTAGVLAARIRRVLVTAAVVALVPAAISFLVTLSQPSNSSFGIRSVEWLRDHGAAGLVAQIESTYYALTAPSKGGATLRALPRVGVGGAAGAASSEYRPARVHAMLHPALAGE